MRFVKLDWRALRFATDEVRGDAAVVRAVHDERVVVHAGFFEGAGDVTDAFVQAAQHPCASGSEQQVREGQQ